MNIDDQPFDRPSSRLGLVAAAFVVTLGLGTGAYFLAQALETGLSRLHTPHIVTVKGLSERQVKADLALWPLRYVEASDELPIAQLRVENDQKAIVDFLKSQGLPDNEMTVERTDVVDLLAREYHSETPNKIRFIAYGNIMIRTNNVDLIQKISSRMTELIKAGVVFTTEGVGSHASLTPYYLFTKLNDVKLEMLAEATKNARAAALQFARDANVPLGGLVQANQGAFSILPGDQFSGATEESQITKTVRVVSTFDYTLGNSGLSIDWLPGKKNNHSNSNTPSP